MPKYTTVQGDTWDMISYKLYGTEKYMSDLIELNQQHVRTVVFSAGVRLLTLNVQPETSSDLPPWKRGGG